MIRNRDIVIVGQQSWDTEIGSNCKDIALEFSRHNRVLYVNTPLDRKTRLLRSKDPNVIKRINVVNKKEEPLIQVNDSLWILYHDVIIESLNWIGSDFVFSALNKRNNKKLAQSIKKALKALRFSNFILFNDGDIFRSFYLKELLSPRILVYYSRDNFLATDYWKKHGAKYEPLLIAQSDVCVANSEYLKDYCSKYNPASFNVGQGIDLSLFDQIDRSSEDLKIVKAVEGPVIGYVGALLSSRLDIALLENIAARRPEWTVALVGPQDEVFLQSKLHHLPNVIFIGNQKPEYVPSFIEAFDVCINPQIINQLTIGNYPRKVDEYLALGKPVVATKTKTMQAFEDVVFLADNPADYERYIDFALNNNSEELAEKRILLARSHSWEKSVQLIYDAILKVKE